MKNKILIALLCITTANAIAQVSYEKRIEFEIADGYINEELLAFGKDGFIISSKNDEYKGHEAEWQYELYNTDLNSVNARTVLLNKKFYADETYNTKERTHTFYKDKKGNFSIVSVSAATLEITKVDGVLPKKSWVKEMAILGDYAYFNASIKNTPYLFSVNWKTGIKNLIPIQIESYKNKDIRLMNFQVLRKSNEIFLYVNAYMGKGKKDTYIVSLNDKGKKEEVYNLTKSIDKNIVSISASKTSEGKYIFTGTYSASNTVYSEGLFFCQAQQSKIDYIKFYNFLELKDFLSYLPQSKQEKIEKKKEKREAKGKEFSLDYRIADHDVILLDDGYLFLGEAYYPTYRTETYYTTSTVNGVTTTTAHTRRVFDGYHYTHAVVANFDKGGNIRWDRSFIMNPAYKPYYVKRFISVAEQNQNSIKMVFASRNRITSKSIGFDGTVLLDVESETIETGFTGDKSKNSFSNIDYWYDNYFLAFGTQTIKNKEDKSVKRKRKVFFISKVKY